MSEHRSGSDIARSSARGANPDERLREEDVK